MENTTHIITPSGKVHTQTIILLHGRDSIASEFASEFLESQASDDRTFLEIFPTTRWVFPSSKMRNSVRFGCTMSQWFDMWTVEDHEEREEIQIVGLRESVEEILDLIRIEAGLVSPDRIVLGGISQGCATAIHALLYGGTRLSGFIGLSSWLPVESEIATAVADNKTGAVVLETPIFLSHSRYDDVVPVANGKKLCMALKKLSMEVLWKEYEDGGHWINEPEGVDDMVSFIHSCCLVELDEEMI